MNPSLIQTLGPILTLTPNSNYCNPTRIERLRASALRTDSAITEGLHTPDPTQNAEIQREVDAAMQAAASGDPAAAMAVEAIRDMKALKT